MEWPRLELIVAADEVGGIGRNGQLPWNLPDESAYFLRMTTQPEVGKKHAAIFGRCTWDSIPVSGRPWKNSISFILSKTMTNQDIQQYKDVYIYSSLPDIIRHLSTIKHSIDRVWVHGGTKVYQEALASPYFHRLYYTHIYATFPCDVHFPAIDWQLVHPVEDKDVPQGVQQCDSISFKVFVYQSLSTKKIVDEDNEISSRTQ